MEITMAKSAGFCFGVERSMNTVYKKMLETRICTYGPIIHNSLVTNDLESKGVRIVNDIGQVTDETLLIRAHGVPPTVYRSLEANKIKFIDCTCPYVKKIHDIVLKNHEANRKIIILGNREHPEIVGIMGYADDTGIIFENEEEVSGYPFDQNETYALVVQTTFNHTTFKKIVSMIKNIDLDINIYNTICNATIDRQREADIISKRADKMLVLGDKMSSNTAKLFEICKKNCKNTFLISGIKDLELNIFRKNDRIGITAGASTPSAIKKEAITVMNELNEEMNAIDNQDQTFEELLNNSLVSLHTGDIVKGTVIQVVNGEVSVNLGYKSDGIISRAEFSDDPTLDPANQVQPDDEIEVFVIRVNDGDGNVLLSKKKVDAQKNLEEMETVFNEKTAIKGKIVEIVKGGVMALINGIRVFVPSSQVSNRFVEDLNSLKGKEFNFNIIEYDRSKRRVVAGRKELAQKEELIKREQVFSTLQVGQRVDAKVSRIVDFGAFVDLGGMDGLIHISELSWGRIKNVRDVLSEGDNVVVTILEMNKEKNKISLSLKDINNDPWLKALEKYPIGEIVDGKVVRMVPFGAFVELEQGVDGLVHISQISSKHVVKPEDELSIGEIIKVKVTEIDKENKKISLSKKEADGTMEAVNQELAAEAAVEEPTVEATETVVEEPAVEAAETVVEEPTAELVEEVTKESVED